MNKTLTYQDKEALAKEFGLDILVVLTFLSVETNGSGFLQSGRPKILFEGHYFHRLTKGIYDASHPHISYPVWTSSHYMKDPEREWDRLNEAISLNREAALKSASWGIGQTMGENHKACGYDNVENMVKLYSMSEYYQLEGALKFIQNGPSMFHALMVKDWETFAHYYNGPKYKVNAYDAKLKAAYDRLA